jgi:hypothetical protein
MRRIVFPALGIELRRLLPLYLGVPGLKPAEACKTIRGRFIWPSPY